MDKDKLAPIYKIPREPGSSSMVWFTNITHGGMIPNAELACQLGALLLAAHYGKDELELQRPLTATDKGDCWQVDGSRSRGSAAQGRGPFHLTIRKYDGRITEINVDYEIQPHPSVQPIIDEHLRQKKSEQDKEK
jgi:hypothetical protein